MMIMKKYNEIVILAAAYVLMLLVIFILPFYSVPEYSIIRNTASQLAAQSAPNAWMMNFTFISLGLGSIIAGWRFLDGFSFHRMILSIFGLSLTLTAFFGHAPVNAGIGYSLSENEWHSYFACITGISFTLFAVSTAFILQGKNQRIMAVAAGSAATILSVLIFEAEQVTGVWQRLIFIICFGWLIYTFRKARTRADIQNN